MVQKIKARISVILTIAMVLSVAMPGAVAPVAAAPGGPATVTDITATPDVLYHQGGSAHVVVTGEGLDSTLQLSKIGADGTSAIASWNNSTGDDISRTFTVSMASNTSPFDDAVSTFKASFDNGVTHETPEATITVKHANTPVIEITDDPEGNAYELNEAADPLTVDFNAVPEATPVDYKWYMVDTAGNVSLVGTGTEYTPSTAAYGIFGYYVELSATVHGKTYTAESDEALVIVANFQYLTIEAGRGGRITQGVSAYYIPGDSIEISATPSSGYKFNNWTTSNGGAFANASNASTTFLMPATATTITANFTVTGGGGGGGGGGGSLSNKPVVTEDTVELDVAGTKEGTKVTAEITGAKADELIKDAKEHGTVVIHPTGASGADTVEVIIHKDTLDTIIKDTKASLEIAAGGMHVKIPHSELSKFSDGISVTATKSGDNTFSVTTKSGDKSVSASVLVSFQNTGGNVAYIVDANGNKTPIKFSSADSGVVYAKVTAPATIVVENHSNLFTDMSGHSMSADADFVANRGLFVGVGNDVFDPNGTMTHAMMASVLHRLAGEPSSAGSTHLPDVDSGAWFQKGAQWAADSGFVDTNNGNFEPDRAITRLDLAVTLYRFAESMGMNPSAHTGSDNLTTFNDVSGLTGEDKAAMEWAYATGILFGYGNGAIGPNSDCTRIQVAAMYERFIDNAVR